MSKRKLHSEVAASAETFAPSGGEHRPLTTDERASFVILALYMGSFCLASFIYWDWLVLKILGVTSATAGTFLFVAAFFNTEGRPHSNSLHPLRSYLISFFAVLATLVLLRYVGGLISNLVISLVVLYTGLLVALIVFRKAMVQVVTALLAIMFLFVTFHNWDAAVSGRMKFTDAMRQCGLSVFRIGPIQDVANMLIAGSYVNYLNRVDYADEQINIVATRTVAGAKDDELRKTRAILDFVSNNIHYVSDPNDGLEYAKDPIHTLIAGGGDCEDQTLVLCSLLESVGVKTYIAFTDEHVFALARFDTDYPELAGKAHVYIDDRPCYALDAADPGAKIGDTSATAPGITRVFDVRSKSLVQFSLSAGG
jgi:hypothetical protein